MRKTAPPPSADAYVADLRGWQLNLVTLLRTAARSSTAVEEVVKWGHLVYLANGPVLLIRAEPERVLFGFWRGQRLGDLEPRLRPGGKFEMATLEFRDGMTISQAAARRLVKAAVALNQTLGDPTQAARPAAARRPAGRRKKRP
jgi:hypothetical protein